MPLADELSFLVARINACAKGNKQLSQHLSRYTNRQSGEEIAWYAGQRLKMDVLTGVAFWQRDGEDSLPIRLSSSCAIPVASTRATPWPARNCLDSWFSWPTPCVLIICQHGKLPGIPKPNPPLSMRWPLSIGICGHN